MRQLQITRRRAARPTVETEPLTENVHTSPRRTSDASVVATLADIDKVLCESR